MHQSEKHTPNRFMLAFFRWFCRPQYREDIEGDLLERFNKRVVRSGFRKANWLFIKEVLLLLRPGIININKPTLYNMKRSNWIKLAIVNLLLVVIIILPFLPGPPNKLVIGLSITGQAAGLLGLLLVPLGLAWAIAEIIQKKNTATAIRLPYGLAIAAIVISTAIYVLLLLAFFITGGFFMGLLAVAPGAYAFYKAVKSTKKLKNGPFVKFNPAPLYLISIPLVALFARTVIVVPVAEFSRDFAIKRSQQLIASIEEYKNKEGHYPESLSELQGSFGETIKGPFIMGVRDFRYTKIDDQYSVSFSQWLELGSLEEIVLYDKANLRNKLSGQYARYDYEFDLCRIKGAFAVYDTRYSDWRYYHVD